MKKWYCIMLMGLCLLLSSCTLSDSPGNSLPGDANNSVGDVEDNQETGQPINQVTVDEQVVLDQDGIRITVKSLSIDDLWGPCLKVLVENSSNRSVTVQVRDLSINGAMVESIFSCDVAAGKKANDEIVFMSSDLEAAGIEIIKEIELKFHVFDSESWDTIFDSEPIRIVTSADASFDQSFEDSGFVALDQHGFKIVIKRLSSEDSLWGADVHVYIENNSNTDATIQIRDMSVNGFMVDPIFSVDVLAGKKAFDTITFLESDLLDNDIDSIEQLEFYFHVFDKDSWDTLFDSEIITVYFE